jgi:hypothetical protein
MTTGFGLIALSLLVAACGGDARSRPDSTDTSRGPGEERGDSTTRSDTLADTGFAGTIAAHSPGRPAHDWLILPDERIGPVANTSSEASLLRTFGDSLLVRDEIYLAEGVCSDGSVLYPATADRLEITWADSARTRPAFLRTDTTGARWATASGIRVGTGLRELEAINGEPFTFSGFGWDYGGGLNWGGSGAPFRMSIRLQPDSASWEIAYADPAVDDIFGDRPVRSDNPLIRRMNVAVHSIIVGFDPPWEEHDCRRLPGRP